MTPQYGFAPQVLDARALAHYVSAGSVSTLDRLVKRGELPPPTHRRGRKRLWVRTHVDEWTARRSGSKLGPFEDDEEVL